MNIGNVSEITGLSIDTLRYYEKIGLIRDIHRDRGGRRDFSETDIKWIEFIKRLKETDMPLKEIKIFADLRYMGDSTVDRRLALLKKHQIRVDRKLNNLLSNKSKIENKIDIYENWNKTT